jgi:hypothetical protein
MGYLPRLLPVCCCLLLHAQSQPSGAFLRFLASHRGPTLVALDGAKGQGALTTLARDEGLLDLGVAVLPPWFQGQDPGLQAWLRSAGGGGCRWLAFGEDGRILGKGAKLPSARGLTGILQDSGVVTPEQTLHTFLKAHPDHQETRAELINLLHRKAVRQTIRILGLAAQRPKREIETESSGSEWGDSAPWMPEGSQQMSQEQDVRIWAPLAQELETLFLDPAWGAAPVELEGYPAEFHSPLMRTMYLRLLPRVREALATRPQTFHLWRLWCRMQAALPERPVTSFIQSLVPLPSCLGVRGTFPPAEALGLVIADARRRKDWGAAAEMLWAAFQSTYGRGEEDGAQGGSASAGEPASPDSDALEEWKNLQEPLLEALVATGQEARAPDVLRQMERQGTLPYFKPRLRALASRLGRKDLAATWLR